MKRLLISGFVVVAVLALTTALHSYSVLREQPATTVGMASLKKSQPPAGASKLPVEEFEDMSFVFTTPVKH